MTAIGLPYTLNSVFLEFEQWKWDLFPFPSQASRGWQPLRAGPSLQDPIGDCDSSAFDALHFLLFCPFPCFCHILHSPFIFPLAHGIMHSVFLCATQPQHCCNKKISFLLNTRLASHSDLVGLCFEFSCEWQGARSCSYRQGHIHLRQWQWEWVTS